METPESERVPDAQEKPASILVVEDNTALRYALTHWLRILNYTVYEAASADEATILLESPLSIDLVITDIEMPGTLNGYDLAGHLRRNFPALPVIVVSGNASRQKIAEIGVFDFFQKPYDFDTIAQRVATLIPQAGKGPKNE
jgi:CheY-like chemotaxis protein